MKLKYKKYYLAFIFCLAWSPMFAENSPTFYAFENAQLIGAKKLSVDSFDDKIEEILISLGVMKKEKNLVADYFKAVPNGIYSFSGADANKYFLPKIGQNLWAFTFDDSLKKTNFLGIAKPISIYVSMSEEDGNFNLGFKTDKKPPPESLLPLFVSVPSDTKINDFPQVVSEDTSIYDQFLQKRYKLWVKEPGNNGGSKDYTISLGHTIRVMGSKYIVLILKIRMMGESLEVFKVKNKKFTLVYSAGVGWD